MILTALQPPATWHCRYCHLEAVPPPLLGLSSLTRLSLSANALEDLPPGPYLGPQLRELQLATNGLRRVPPALASATNLRSLDLSFNWQVGWGRRPCRGALMGAGGVANRPSSHRGWSYTRLITST